VSGWVDGVLAVAAVPPLAASAYLGGLALLAGRPRPMAPGTRTRFDVIVPAHNEEGEIATTVASLLALEYPGDRFRVLVVADNCTDATAERAREAGATVLERTDRERRGKGYALAHAYAASLADGVADAVVVVDADTLVSPNLLSAFAARFEAGAEAVQAEYGVRNPNASWRTRLMRIAFTLFHTLRSNARERLGLSCGLRGNGMGFSTGLLRRVPPRAFSIVEDVEYGVALGMTGTRVMHVAEAEVLGEMPATAAASTTQRERWERGRWALVREHVPGLLGAARAHGRVPLDLAADLLVPPLTVLVALVGTGALVALGLYLRGLAGPVGVTPWAVAVACVLAYVARGVALSGVGLRALPDLLWAPVYALWKLTLLVRPKGRAGEWVRTARSHDA